MGFIEDAFRLWYAKRAKGLDPDPDAPEHKYEYRGAFMSGSGRNSSGHWPSSWKSSDHPNRFVDGEDTITGRPAQWWANKRAAENFQRR